ncbi:WLM domain-containing protein [Desarmillaria tabescens]|uniref:WLM domain-containing protein n=1 Tax=Armillaria tabescens TaxID=1929756 RepID=A0AA39T583_ARMTA|nr:WLM domain-containing protein [Desarmillaria tabescens]KAK0465491.1 WLM domain-containing protein [Desarmillaria tabescens]
MSTDIFIKSFTHLTGRPKADQALQMLQKVASMVKPIMRTHKWVLPTLAEFFPDQSNLLVSPECVHILFNTHSCLQDVNMGQKILLRLRPAYSPGSFLDIHDVVQTMLHELTHNVHGPHDDKFYKFLSGLQDEYEKLVRTGYAGEGFFSKGHRLGGDASCGVPLHMSRAKALEAAEKRRHAAQVLGGGGRRVGTNSSGTRSGKSLRELAAMAAEQRARDEKACGLGTHAEQEAEKAAKESVVIDLTGYDYDEDSDPEVIIVEDSREKKPGSSKKPVPTRNKPSSSSLARTGESSNTAKRRPAKSHASVVSDQWSCTVCTLLNAPMVLQCDACLTPRPSDGWTCLTCGQGGMAHDSWMCTFCGQVKTYS